MPGRRGALLGLGGLGLKQHLRRLLPSRRLVDAAGAGAGRGDLGPAAAEEDPLPGWEEEGASASQSSSVSVRSPLPSRLRGGPPHPPPRARGSHWVLCFLQKQPVFLLTDAKQFSAPERKPARRRPVGLRIFF